MAVVSERTGAYVLGGLTVLAWVIFWNGLIWAASHTHPTSPTSHAALNLLHGDDHS
jgi:hypothetical protein